MKRLISMIVGIYLFLGGGLAWVDATIDTTFRTGGIKGAGATEGTTIRRYQANKMVESSSSKFTGAILSRLAGGSESINITPVSIKGSTGVLTLKTGHTVKVRSKPSKKGNIPRSGEKKRNLLFASPNRNFR